MNLHFVRPGVIKGRRGTLNPLSYDREETILSRKTHRFTVKAPQIRCDAIAVA